MKLKKKELVRAKQIVNKFCSVNQIKFPVIKTKNDLDSFGCYFHESNEIYINLGDCDLSTKRNNPGMTRENTITGCLAHELGHYLHFMYHSRYLTTKFKTLKEPLINYWETQIKEDIAESIRLFIINPTLLEEGRPKRYKILHGIFDPITDTHYTEVLKGLDFQKRRIINLWLEQIV